jgi:hypothetical protein
MVKRHPLSTMTMQLFQSKKSTPIFKNLLKWRKRPSREQLLSLLR